MTRELMQQALDALKDADEIDVDMRDAIMLIEAALAQPAAGYQCEPQPVQPASDKLREIIAATYQIAGVYDAPEHVLDVLSDPEGATQAQIDALLPFAQPVQRPWVGLTDDEATALWEATHNDDSWELIKRVEAKLKEKNI